MARSGGAGRAHKQPAGPDALIRSGEAGQAIALSNPLFEMSIFLFGINFLQRVARLKQFAAKATLTLSSSVHEAICVLRSCRLKRLGGFAAASAG